MIDDLPLRVLASDQHGLVSVEQAAGLGFDKDRRHRLVDRRRWERVLPRVIGLVGVPASPARTALAGVLAAGHNAALHSSSAGAWWGIPGNLLQPLDIVRDRGRSGAQPPARCHEPKLLLPHHVVRLEGVPTVVPARALFEIAGQRRRGAQDDRWVERVARMVDTAWSMNLVSGRTLHALFDEMARRGRSGTAVMRLVLADRGLDYVPPASGVEARVVQLLHRAGEPPLDRQVDTGSDRWIGRVDFRDPILPFVLEVQSERFHTSRIDQQLDGQRFLALETGGFVVRQVTDVDVWHRPSRVIEVVREGRGAARRLVRANRAA